MSNNATIVQYYFDQIQNNYDDNKNVVIKPVNNKTNANISFIDMIYNKIKLKNNININKSNDNESK
jgi:ribosomal protein S17E